MTAFCAECLVNCHCIVHQDCLSIALCRAKPTKTDILRQLYFSSFNRCNFGKLIQCLAKSVRAVGVGLARDDSVSNPRIMRCIGWYRYSGC